MFDELTGRRCTKTLGLLVFGSLGVIARAKPVGGVAEAGSLVVAAREAWLYSNEALARAVLQELGET